MMRSVLLICHDLLCCVVFDMRVALTDDHKVMAVVYRYILHLDTHSLHHSN